MSHLHNGEHFTYHTIFCDMVNKATPSALRIEALFAVFLTVYAKLNEALNKIMKSEQSAMVARVNETSDLTPLVLRTVRGEIDKAYRDIVRRINALPEISDTDEDAPRVTFITDLNVLIDRTNNLLAVREGIANAVEQERGSDGTRQNGRHR